MRYSPLKAQGRRGREMEHIRAVVWPAVLRRANYSCENCAARADRGGLEWAHVFGRPGTGLRLGAWANLPQLTMALCGPCHVAYDRRDDDDVAHRLRWAAIRRLASITKHDLTQIELVPPLAVPSEAIRGLIRYLEAAGWSADGAGLAAPPGMGVF